MKIILDQFNWQVADQRALGPDGNPIALRAAVFIDPQGNELQIIFQEEMARKFGAGMKGEKTIDVAQTIPTVLRNNGSG